MCAFRDVNINAFTHFYLALSSLVHDDDGIGFLMQGLLEHAGFTFMLFTIIIDSAKFRIICAAALPGEIENISEGHRRTSSSLSE